MKSSRIYSVLAILLFAIVCISLVNATVIVSGKTYDPKVDSGNEVTDVNVIATCYGVSTLSKNTNSIVGGSYGIGFDNTECSPTDRITVSFSKGTRYGTSLDFIVNTKSINVLTDSFVIENLVLDKTQSTSTGSSRHNGGSTTRYYQCGNGLCDSGESTETCPQDCAETKINEPIITPKEVVELNPTQNTQTQNPNVFARITGAVTGVAGALGTAGSIVVIVFIVGIIGMAISVNIIRRKRNSSIKASKK